ncbi:endonuclease III domain-containing protein [Caldivirga maquilingensis]|uniref:DNA-(Apurinic or apyrimidinic site) lyase n=1 Tax=Caldivirga maquilingensis (strain ATCC 700844 / DSM 13496 / JCM 10307 / IC-167) TaxID=397948 RepID=A8MBH1_CALMQ|nr:endonuclease III [Caldivirga maquilingensis]ABW02704.1 DNA-(apurinic or apyrimidinic site) lyase [Caldivirga maquilingensis IC-167]
MEGLTRDDVFKALSLVTVNEREFLGRWVFTNNASVFEGLVAVMLTQNTSDKVATRVYERLKERLGSITPNTILSLSKSELENILRPIGSFRQRARRLIELANTVNEKYNGSLEFIRGMGTDEARRTLMNLPGVGPKTADVVLLNLGKPVFPVDTHIMRISHRLGVMGGYEKVSAFWIKLLKPNEYLMVHLGLIAFGRAICRSRRPLCEHCPLRVKCKYYLSISKSNQPHG